MPSRTNAKRDFIKLFEIGLTPGQIPSFGYNRHTLYQYYSEWRKTHTPKEQLPLPGIEREKVAGSSAKKESYECDVCHEIVTWPEHWLETKHESQFIAGAVHFLREIQEKAKG